ncbi:trypsin-like peptidase domain-containing protein [Gammaproteobacteria bacterium]|nr:trypsin-like peptidase domain-containing protein [Gammaproteobacteria bacterium]
MKKLFKNISHFLAWPIFSGVLIALVLIQYQLITELDRLSQSNAIPFSTAIKKAAPSVVSINATSVNVGSIERTAKDKINLYLKETESLGSGVIISSQGFILTKLHVVDTLFDAFDAEVTLRDGRRTTATVIAWDEPNDLAVLHVNLDGLTPISIGAESKSDVGDIVFAIGYPRNIGQSVSQGIISALDFSDQKTIGAIQTDAAINPGNSGGALINRSGDLIGINSSILSESGNFEGIGFATPAHFAIDSMNTMISKAIEDNHGYLGVVTGEALNQNSSQLFFGRDDIRGMLVESIDPGSAAERAGVFPGDVITKVGDTLALDERNIIQEIRKKKPTEKVILEVYRSGDGIKIPIILGFGQAFVIE